MSMDFLKGYKTYIGLFMSIMGMLSAQLGWEWWVELSDQVRATIEQFMMFAGAAFALYGNYMSKRREKQLMNGG